MGKVRRVPSHTLRAVLPVQQHIKPARILSVCIAGVVCGFLTIVATIGHGSLLFTDDLRAFVPEAVGLALFSTMVMTAICFIAGSRAGLTSMTQDIPVVAMTPVVASVAASVDPALGGEARFATIIAAVAVVTMVTGLVTFAIGWFRLGGMIRFTPYPVIAGFLGGTGWLIVLGGIGVATDETPISTIMSHLGSGPLLLQIALTVLVALALAVTERLATNALAIPALLLAFLLLFNLAVLFGGGSYEALRAEGWLLTLPSAGRLWPPIEPSALTSIDWRAVAGGMLNLPVVVVVGIVGLLMNATGIELHSKRDVDLDHEMRLCGAMNLIAGASAGLPGYPSVSLAVLAGQLDVTSRWVALIVSLLTLVALLLGSILLDAVPVVLLGGILLWVGASLMFEWLVRSRRRIAPFEYGLVLLIFLVIAVVSFPAGILVGLIAAVGLFAFEYGRVDVVRHDMTGADYQSSVTMPEQRREMLRRHGAAIRIVRLQGFLFFGTADRLRRRVLEGLPAGESRARFLLIDFRRVSGLDSSAVLSFVRLGQAAASRGFTLVLTNLPDRIRASLRHNGIEAGEGQPIVDQGSELPSVRFEPELERGLLWCEDRLLAEIEPDRIEQENWTLARLLQTFLRHDHLASQLAGYCERVDVAGGGSLIEQGAAADDIFFVQSGHGTVRMTGDNGLPVQLASIGPGAVVGEIAFYLRGPRSASIVAAGPVVAWRFSRADLMKLAADLPDAAAGFHQAMSEMLSRRLTATNQLVRFLAD